MNKKRCIFVVVALIIGIIIGMFLPKSSNSFEKADMENIINTKIAAGGNIKVKEIKDFGNVTEMKLDIEDSPKEESLFVSDNGKVFFAKVVDLDELEKAKKEAENAKKINNKTDKPKIELFVMSYCPFGTQAEKGYLPAVQKLGDKIDAKVKFVNYVMHPDQGEGEENLLQYCIQKEMPKKFNAYLGCFLEKGDSEGCLIKNGISKDALKTCLDETDKKYAISENKNDKTKWLNGRFPKFNVQDDLNKKYGVQGSPTLVINGQKIEGVGRDANSIFKVICSAFKNQPEECKENLSTESPAPGFGYDNSGDNSSAGGCGA